MVKAYFFRGSEYIRFDLPTDKVDKGPTPIKGNWAGFPSSWTKVDAAVNWGNGKVYMFNGANYIRYDIMLDKIDQGEKLIFSNWPGFPIWDRVDAAVNWGNGKVYFFRGDQYIRYDIFTDMVDQAEKPIHGNWPGFPASWTKVDAAVNRGDDRVYLFNGSNYIRYSVAQDKVTQTEKPIHGNWPGFPASWTSVGDGVVIDTMTEKMGFLLDHNIRPETVGFAYVIFDGNRMAKSGHGGYRFRPKDGGLKYSINTEMGIGSITKSLTTMGMIRCLKDHDFDVDEPIISHLPGSWQKGTNIDTISFRELMMHTSGFRSSGDDYQSLKAMIQTGVMMSDKVYQYRNPNFSLMRILIPLIDGTTLTDNETTNAQIVADAYKAYMWKYVFGPSGVANADCKLNSSEFALLYGPPSDDSGSYPYSNNDDSTTIAGAGGWKLSTLELAKVMNTFLSTERILPADLRDQMITDELGCYSSGDVRMTHNGAWDDGVRGYHNCYYVFDDGILCVLMTNSTYAENPMSPEFAVKAAHAASYGA
jgi:CubicO group peptidase (beta-lactamase class C family)